MNKPKFKDSEECKKLRVEEDRLFDIFQAGPTLDNFKEYSTTMKEYLKARRRRLVVHVEQCDKRDDGAKLDLWSLNLLYGEDDVQKVS